MASRTVGIVMLSYNRADIVCKAIQSIALAKNEVNYELYLLDNCSKAEEFALIKECFEETQKNYNISGIIIRLNYNSGFPAGNNMGIKYFLEKSHITHLCLLNSDVIVTDYWLDRMLEQNEDAIGPVTNACGNEQTIPIDFVVTPNSVDINQINTFAQQRNNLFNNLKTYTNFLGFFCFLGSRQLFEKVGYLDEMFGRGAYEDDDFCIRILNAGYKLAIIRSVFLFHFGSASFSQVPLKSLFKHLDDNKKMFEDKHKKKWENRNMLPYLSFKQDMDYLIQNHTDTKNLQIIFNLYYDNIKILMQSLFNNRENPQINKFTKPHILHRIKRRIFRK